MHKEEQDLELEALEAIYSSELEIICNDFPDISFKVHLNSAENDENNVNDSTFFLTLTLSFPTDYPDVIPTIRIECLDDIFSQHRLEKLAEDLVEIADKNLSMPMAFTLISSLQEHIGHLVDEIRNKKNEAADMKKQREEEETRRKFEGTKVTVESFLAWRKKFDDEQFAKQEKRLVEETAELAGKLTGKQLFLKDSTLNLSDITIIQQDGQVEIDESLFADVDDLEFDED